MKAIIIGSGLGGLLSAARLSKAGYEVEVFERLPIIGGRFTNINYQGFQLSTGALHMVPHGPAGPLSQLLEEVGADVEIIRKKPTAVIRIPRKKGDTDYKFGHKDLPFQDFKVPFSLLNRLKLIYYIASTRKNPPQGNHLNSGAGNTSPRTGPIAYPMHSSDGHSVSKLPMCLWKKLLPLSRIFTISEDREYQWADVKELLMH